MVAQKKNERLNEIEMQKLEKQSKMSSVLDQASKI